MPLYHISNQSLCINKLQSTNLATFQNKKWIELYLFQEVPKQKPM
jgi:hypothetical protein